MTLSFEPAGMKPCDNDVCNALSYSKFEAGEYPNMKNNRRWDSVSTQGQSLVLKLLERDPLKRLSAEQVRCHSLPGCCLCTTGMHSRQAGSSGLVHAALLLLRVTSSIRLMDRCLRAGTTASLSQARGHHSN